MSTSCKFTPLGNTNTECFNKCQEENKGNCSSYCKNTCDRCDDPTECKWIGNQNDIDNIKSVYNSLTNELKLFQKKESEFYGSKAQENSNIDNINKIKDLENKRKLIWQYLVNSYNVNTQISKANYNIVENKDSVKHSQVGIERGLRKQVKDLENKNTSVEKMIRINKSISNRYKSLSNILTFALVYVAILTIVPIFILMPNNIMPLNRTGAGVLWGVLVVILFIIVLTRYYGNKSNRDDIINYERNFKKPTDSNILKSKLALNDRKMKEGEVVTDFDPTSVDIGNINRYVNEPNKCDKK